jgi:hypothetical protein
LQIFLVSPNAHEYIVLATEKDGRRKEQRLRQGGKAAGRPLFKDFKNLVFETYENAQELPINVIVSEGIW